MVGASRLQQEKHGPIQASNANRQYWLDCGLSVLATGAATLLRLTLAPLVGSAVPFVTYFAATVILAWYRGFWPAAFNILLSVFAGGYFVLWNGGLEPAAFGRTAGAPIIGFTLLMS
jgi:hypothetical protein